MIDLNNISSIEAIVYTSIFKFAAEWSSGEYESIEQCPGYEPLNNFCNCYNSIVKMLFTGEEAKENLISPQYFVE